MEIIKKANGKNTVKITQRDWESYGLTNGWLVSAQNNDAQNSEEQIEEQVEGQVEEQFKKPDSYEKLFKGLALEEAKEALGGDKSMFATISSAIVWLVHEVEASHPSHDAEFYDLLFEKLDDSGIKKVFGDMWNIANSTLRDAGYDMMPENGDISMSQKVPSDYERFFVEAGARALESEEYVKAVNLFRFAGYAFYASEQAQDFREVGKDSNLYFFSREYAKYEDGYVLNGLWPSAQMDLITNGFSRMPIPEGY